MMVVVTVVIRMIVMGSGRMSIRGMSIRGMAIRSMGVAVDVIMMSIELILLAVTINLAAFSCQTGDLTGQVFALFVLTVAAAESAIGLAILVAFYRNRGSIAVEDINALKG